METLTQQVLVGLAGHARSGKSTLAEVVARRLAADVAGFGDVVRQRVAEADLDPTDRNTLMDVGHAWALADPESLCAATLATVSDPARPIVLEGIRHLGISAVLRRSRGFTLVFVDAPDWVISNRLAGAADPRRHPCEAEIPMLRRAADIIVDGTRRPESVADDIVAVVRDRQHMLADRNAT